MSIQENHNDRIAELKREIERSKRIIKRCVIAIIVMVSAWLLLGLWIFVFVSNISK